MQSQGNLLARAACACVSIFLAGCGGSGEPNATGSASTGVTAGSSATTDPGTTSDGGSSDGTSTTTDGTSDGGSSGGGGGFVPDPDVFDVASCDPWAQDCPDGEKCVPYKSPNGTTWDANRCVKVVDKPKTPGEACTELGGSQSGEDDCDATSTCNWVVGGVGLCVAMCTGSAASPICEVPGTSCNIDNDGTRNLCNPLCDPILQDCPDNTRMTCLIANGSDTFNCELGWGEDGLQPGDECFFDNSCLNGNLCIYQPDAIPNCTGAGCCAPYCDLNDPQCPADGTECISFFDGGVAPPMYAHVGVCLLPG